MRNAYIYIAVMAAVSFLYIGHLVRKYSDTVLY